MYFAQLGHETALAPSYPDLLNPKVTKTFIAGSHEADKRVLGRHFGDTIPLVVSDPLVDNLPWTGDPAAAPSSAPRFVRSRTPLSEPSVSTTPCRRFDLQRHSNSSA